MQRNIVKANYYSRFAYEKGYLPIAPHTIFPQFLSDDNAQERKEGMLMGLQLLEMCEELWVFGPFISEGMKKEIEYARHRGMTTRYFSEGLEET